MALFGAETCGEECRLHCMASGQVDGPGEGGQGQARWLPDLVALSKAGLLIK